MNPLTNIKNLRKLTERELELGYKKSWHDEYKDSAWIFVGGLPYDLTEGDVICIFSQYGEIVNINLVRDLKTGKSKGFAFICFQDQRSTILSVDNLNGAKVLGRQMRVDHVKDYKMPKEHGDEDEATLKLRQEGCAPRIESSPEKEKEVKSEDKQDRKQKKAMKKEKKSKKKKKKKRESSSSEDEEEDEKKKESSSEDEKDERKPSARFSDERIKKEEDDIKQEKIDIGYDKALKRQSHMKPRSRRHDFSSDDDSDNDRHGRKMRRKDNKNDNNIGERSRVKEERLSDEEHRRRRSRDRDYRRGERRSRSRDRESRGNHGGERNNYDDRNRKHWNKEDGKKRYEEHKRSYRDESRGRNKYGE